MRETSLARKLLLMVAVVALLLVGFSLWLVEKGARQTIEAGLARSFDQHAALLQLSLESELAEVERSLEAMVLHPGLVDSLAQGDRAAAREQLHRLRLRHRESLLDYLFIQREDDPAWLDGSLVQGHADSTARLLLLDAGAEVSSHWRWLTLQDDEGRSHYLLATSRSLIHPDTGRVYARLLAGIVLNHNTPLLHRLRLRSGIAALGLLVDGRAVPAVAGEEDVYRRLFGDTGRGKAELPWRKATRAVSYQGQALPVEWAMVVAHEDELGAIFYRNAGLLLPVILLALLLLFLLLHRQVVQPLNALARDVRRLAHERDRHLVVPTSHRNDEIGSLARTFNTMVAELGINEQRYRTILDEASVIYWETDREINFTFISSHVERMLGYSVAMCYQPGFWEKHIHPEDRQHTLSALQTAMRGAEDLTFEYRMLHASGAIVWIRDITRIERNRGRVQRLRGVMVDITERKEAEDRIHELAFFDPLTGLPNRRLLLDRLHQALASSARSGAYGALLFIDLDNFKTLNDTMGHEVGDLLLVEVARRLHHSVRDVDTVARQGGDEFVVMLEGVGNNHQRAVRQVETVAEKLLAALNQLYLLQGKHYHSTPSIGITLFRGSDKPVDELLRHADMAMYRAKAAGRNAIRFFEPAMQAFLEERTALEHDLRRALLDQCFLLYYQPQFDSGNCLVGVEALVRWEHPERGMISPGEFIPLAEETGLILPLGQWVLEQACLQLARWQQERGNLVSMAVNISPRQFRHVDFVEQVRAVVAATGVDTAGLKLEITESMMLEDVDDTVAIMAQLKELGVGFSIDDFGTGYSSLSYLKRLPLNQLKIDQSFVRDVVDDLNDAVIVRAIIAMADSLGFTTIAEGVETEAQRLFLAREGCHFYQGYLFGRPLPAEEIDALLRQCMGEA